MMTRFVCFEVLADHHSEVFVLANIGGQVRQCGGWHDFLPGWSVVPWGVL